MDFVVCLEQMGIRNSIFTSALAAVRLFVVSIHLNLIM
jgi:hypothetical protein